MAEGHEKGTLPAVLANLTTLKAVYPLLRAELEMVPNGWHAYSLDTGKPAVDTDQARALWALLQPKSEAEKKAEALEATIRGLTFSQIPGYFPTPGAVINEMLDYIDSDKPFTVLEPSAGAGAILDAVTAKYPGVKTVVYEFNHTLSTILEGKDYPVLQVDFMSVEAVESVDYVLMNPPFENLQDIEHIQHAFKFLKPGGRLIAIMSPGGFFRQDKKAQAFRAWFEGQNGQAQDLPEKAFASSGTGVNTKLIIVDKCEADAAPEPEKSDNVYTCSRFAERLEARKDRLEERAEKAQQAADQAYQRSHDLVKDIPFGQPILVGHHSEQGHRRTLAKSWQAMGKSVDLSGKADHLASKASTVGTGGVLSDDPEALDKLNSKLQKLTEKQAFMKQANAAIRSGKASELEKLNLSAAQIEALKTPDFAGRIGFADYQLSNNGSEIRRLKKRIETLQRLHAEAPLDIQHPDFSISIEDGRIKIEFSQGKPCQAVREKLAKGYAFKWSRYSGAWVRKATANGIAEAERLAAWLQEQATIYEGETLH